MSENSEKCIYFFSKAMVMSKNILLCFFFKWVDPFMYFCSAGGTSTPGWKSLFYCSLFLNNYHNLSLLLLFCMFLSTDRRVLQPSDCVYSESLTPQGKLMACRRDLTEILVCKCTVLLMPPFLCNTQAFHFFHEH